MNGARFLGRPSGAGWGHIRSLLNRDVDERSHTLTRRGSQRAPPQAPLDRPGIVAPDRVNRRIVTVGGRGFLLMPGAQL